MSTQVDMVCEFGVLQALATAGKRGRLPRSVMGRLMQDGVPAFEVHTRIALASSPADCDRLLAGAWDILHAILPADTATPLVDACNAYTRGLIVCRDAFHRPHLIARLDYARAHLAV